MDWRKIEAALLDWAQSSGYGIFIGASGDRYLDCDSVVDVSLSDLAKHLADNLKPEASK